MILEILPFIRLLMVILFSQKVFEAKLRIEFRSFLIFTYKTFLDSLERPMIGTAHSVGERKRSEKVLLVKDKRRGCHFII
jgi:hypothetical protein